MCWKLQDKDVEISPADHARMERERFKAANGQSRAVLLTFAQRHPGALSAHFLSQVRQKLRGPAARPTKTSHLKEVSLTDWVTQSSGLQEIRDVREAQTIACAIDAVNRNSIAEALDILVMRLHALQSAKSKGGSWDKAAVLELIPSTGSGLLPAGLAGITS